MSPANALLEHLKDSHLAVGDRGELIAALLLLLARDKAATTGKTDYPNRSQPAHSLGLPSSSPDQHLKDDGVRMKRVVSLISLLTSLLPFTTAELSEKVPSQARIGEDTPLGTAFKDSYVWFNHFVKVDDFKVLNQEYLRHLVARGAAVICANNQQGIDILIPVIMGPLLRQDHITAIFFQIKNSLSYGANILPALFDVMHPIKVVGLFKETTDLLPVVRIVFALASNQSCVQYRNPPSRPSLRHPGAEYTAYDIWCAGATHETFPVIPENQDAIYASLLQRSLNLFEAYDLKDATLIDPTVQQKRSVARRRMNPGTSTRVEHYENYVAGAAVSKSGGERREETGSDLDML
ncbi:hypothetical protein B0H10DRAFT_1839359 [Mycena sp. CBHHK59/15]|nr:hypothetical protein B0H10DRAFT_1839359 [Mycena sp. CBHHK59/15]